MTFTVFSVDGLKKLLNNFSSIVWCLGPYGQNVYSGGEYFGQLQMIYYASMNLGLQLHVLI